MGSGYHWHRPAESRRATTKDKVCRETFRTCRLADGRSRVADDKSSAIMFGQRPRTPDQAIPALTPHGSFCHSAVHAIRPDGKEKHGSLKFHGGEAWGRGVQGAFGAYSGCILPSLVVSSLSRPRSLLFASCCLLFWRVFVRSLRELAGFKEGSLRRLRSFILAIFASKDGRRS